MGRGVFRNRRSGWEENVHAFDGYKRDGGELEKVAMVMVATACIDARTDRLVVFARWCFYVPQSNAWFLEHT